MIEIAFVSGWVGEALYRDSDVYYSLRPGLPPIPVAIGELQKVLVPGNEFEVITGTDFNDVSASLDVRTHLENAVFLTITLLDADISISTRVLAAQSLETMLESSDVRGHVLRRLVSRSLPVEYRAQRRHVMSPLSEFQRIREVLQIIFDSQPILDQFWFELSATLDEYGIEPTIRIDIETELINSGLVQDVCKALQEGSVQRLNSSIVQFFVSHPAIINLPNARAALNAFRSRLQRTFLSRAKGGIQRVLKLRRGSDASSATTAHNDLISELTRQGARPQSLRHVGALESKARVDKQISAIRDMLFAGKNVLAQKYARELLAFQLGQGDKEHAAMSLCSLTAISLDANQLEVADWLSDIAVKLYVDDPVVYCSRAEVFKRRGHFQSALQAYEEVRLRFSRHRYAENGYADVLLEMGRFEDSLSEYKRTQQIFPDDPVAFNGEVSVLKAKGDFQLAFKRAVGNAKKFPYDAWIRAMVASCLAALGKPEEAAKHYRQAIYLDAGNDRNKIAYAYTLKAVGRVSDALAFLDAHIEKFDVPAIANAKANILRSVRRFDDALQIYTSIMKRFPTYTPAKLGAAAIQVLLGNVEQARHEFPEEHMESELDWYGFRAFALSYVSVGCFQEAIQKLDWGIRACPWLRERTKMETALGYAELRHRDLRASVAILQRNLNRLDNRNQQIRLVLLSHAQAEAGQTDIAKVLLNRVSSSKDPQLREIQRALVATYSEGLPTIETSSIDRLELNLAMAA